MSEYFRDYNQGCIEIICGPMFSGKTEELIRRVNRAKIARRHVFVSKPAIDDRYSQTHLVSHSAHQIASTCVKDTESLAKHLYSLGKLPNVLGIDEIQFFSPAIIDLVEDMARKGVRVIAAGLDQDYLGKPFGSMPHLLAIADMVTKQYAVCVVCGMAASKSQRTYHSGQRAYDKMDKQILIGQQDSYEARCRNCYVQGIALSTLSLEGIEATQKTSINELLFKETVCKNPL